MTDIKVAYCGIITILSKTTTGVTCRAIIANPSEAHEIPPIFSGVCVA